MIQNGADTPLNQNPGTLPNVQGALLNWLQPMTFTLIVKTVENAVLVETPTDISTMGVRQPFTSRQLSIKPEGQRQWLWETMHCLPGIDLKTDDVIVFNGVKYRVMQSLNWTEYGYNEFHIVQGYTSDP